MAITTLNGLISATAAAQRIRIFKSATRTAVAATPFSVFELAGDPGAGVLAGTSTTAGVVPTDATQGIPIVNAFSGANQGYITKVEASSPVVGRIAIYDLLFKAGAYAFNANTALTAQPSYASRLLFDGVTDYKSTQIWYETVTAFTGNPTFTITYTNQDGTGSRSTGGLATGAALIVGRMGKFPFQAGDTGVQKIDNVQGTIATVGTFNILVMRKLWEGRIRVVNDLIVHGPDLTGLPQVFANSALVLVINPDSTATSTPEVTFDIANG
jgi:hypothetical protein